MTTTSSGTRTTINVARYRSRDVYRGFRPAPVVPSRRRRQLRMAALPRRIVRQLHRLRPRPSPGSTAPNAPTGFTPSTTSATSTFSWCRRWAWRTTSSWGSSMGGWVSARNGRHVRLQPQGPHPWSTPPASSPSRARSPRYSWSRPRPALAQRFYDTSQVENYDQYTRELTPEEQVTQHSNAEMALPPLLASLPPQPQPSPLPRQSQRSFPHRLGTPEDAIIPVECGELFEKGHRQLQLEDHRQLRPLPGHRKTGRVRRRRNRISVHPRLVSATLTGCVRNLLNQVATTELPST